MKPKISPKTTLSGSKRVSRTPDVSRLSHDVARVTRPGTVTVTEFQVINITHVMHITSNVEQLDPSKDALDALFSALPVGTVSGAQ